MRIKVQGSIAWSLICVSQYVLAVVVLENFGLAIPLDDQVEFVSAPEYIGLQTDIAGCGKWPRSTILRVQRRRTH
jgi:hypothetical protein